MRRLLVCFATIALPGVLATGGSAKVYTIKPDSTGDFATIQEAIDVADSLDIIELTDGVFTGAGNRNLDYAGKAITIRSRSGDPLACVIDCQGTGARSEAHRGFLFHSGEGPGSVIQGITITDGQSGGK
ncbi:hypothetical protein ACFL6M_07930 [Candidatus Eisenbacteria bacterium]|uniref:DUF1565 domain-containing protein n=1 Tax=Eiseniibacteriota bacterium TaxID=2212470 RepID=A0ABV6YMF9_UNCEI